MKDSATLLREVDALLGAQRVISDRELSLALSSEILERLEECLTLAKVIDDAKRAFEAMWVQP